MTTSADLRLTVACPLCGAGPQERCRTLSSGDNTGPHNGRLQAAPTAVQPLDVRCPACDAPAGAGCMKGHDPIATTHNERRRSARVATAKARS